MTRIKVDRKSLRFPRIVIEPVLRGFASQAGGYSLDELIQQLGTTPEQFNDAAFTIDGEQMVELSRWLREKTAGQLDIREILSRFSATSAGLAGMAALSARNVRESLLVAVRYLPLLIPAMRADLIEDHTHVRFTLEMTADLGGMNRFLIELVTAAINIISADVMSQPIPRTIHFTHGYSSSEHTERRMRDLEEILGHPVVFNSTFNGMEGFKADLDVPTRSPNEATFSTVKRILENEMASQAAARTFAGIVRHELMKLANEGRYPSLEAFAERMNLSPRTLVRKLAGEDTSYKQLSNEIRLRLATELLDRTHFSIKQIATRVGFTNANSFSRAFKAVRGETPVEWRNRGSRKD